MPIMTFMTRFYHNSIPQRRTFSVFFLNNYFTALMAGLLLLAASCEEDPTHIGRKLLPSGDFVSIASADSFAVKSWTMYRDTVRSDNPSLSYLGQLFDPYFGTTTASFATQVRLGYKWNYSYFKVDSVRLYLRFLSVSGSVDEPHFLKLSRIDEQLYDSLTYYSNKSVPLTGYSEIIPLPALKPDSINDITLVIDTLFAKEILAQPSWLFYDTLTRKQADFRSYFKGLLFELESPSEPLMVSMSLKNSQYGIVCDQIGCYYNLFIIYMHNEVDEPISYTIKLDTKNQNASFNRYIHNVNDGLPDKRILHVNDTTILDSLSYAQIMNGVYTKLRIPGLEAIKNNPDLNGIAVNKARLVIPYVTDGNIYTNKSIPSQLLLSYYDKNGIRQFVPDYNPYNTAFFGGKPDTSKYVYNLNIATYVQNYLEDKTGLLKPELELFLYPNSPNNIILKANSSHFPVKLEFTYTRF